LQEKQNAIYCPKTWYLSIKKRQADIYRAAVGTSRLALSFRLRLNENHRRTIATCSHNPFIGFRAFGFASIILICILGAVFISLFTEYGSAGVLGFFLAIILLVPFVVYENIAHKIMRSYIEVVLEAQPYKSEDKNGEPDE
jgi:hypothetical protein